MQNVYRLDVAIGASAYIRADDPDEARTKLEAWIEATGGQLEVAADGVIFTARQFDDPLLPDVSLSPAMTNHGPDEGEAAELVYSPAGECAITASDWCSADAATHQASFAYADAAGNPSNWSFLFASPDMDAAREYARGEFDRLHPGASKVDMTIVAVNADA